MITIDTTKEIARLKRDMNKIQRKQLPYASMLAVNEVAKNAQKSYKIQATRYLDRPTPGTVNGTFIRFARDKENPRALVGLKDFVAKYLGKQIDGGSGGSTAVPVNANLNAFGNIPGRRGGAVRRMGDRKGAFTAGTNSNLPRGVYQRVGGKRNPRLKMLVAFEQSVTFKPRFPYMKIMIGTIKNTFPKELGRAIEKALRTAR